MPYLIVKSESEKRRIPYTIGQSIRQTLDMANIRVRSGCRGTGACGLCLVKVEAGDAGELSENERLHLDDDAVEDGIRLACQMFPDSDLTIRIMAPAPKSNWRPLETGVMPDSHVLPPRRHPRFERLPEDVKKPLWNGCGCGHHPHQPFHHRFVYRTAVDGSLRPQSPNYLWRGYYDPA